MSSSIAPLQELQDLLYRMNLKPKSVEELGELITSINQSYPEADWLRVAKLLATVPTSVSLGVAGVVSFLLTAINSKSGNAGVVLPGLAIIWGAAGFICLTAVLGSLVTSRSLTRDKAVQGQPAELGLPPGEDRVARRTGDVERWVPGLSPLGIMTQDQQ